MQTQKTKSQKRAETLALKFNKRIAAWSGTCNRWAIASICLEAIYEDLVTEVHVELNSFANEEKANFWITCCRDAKIKIAG